MLEAMLACKPKTGPTPGLTSLLMHFDGTNNSTDMIDEVGHPCTAFGTAVLSTTKKAFGPTSLRLTGANTATRVQVPDAADLRLSGDFTIEMMLNLDNISSNYVLMEKSPGASGRCYIEVFDTETRLCLNGTTTSFGTGQLPSAGSWFHYAITRKGTKVSSFAAGIKKGEITRSEAWGANVGALVIGNVYSAVLNAPVYMDDLRIVRECLYTADFAPPTGPLTM